jgi:hypothetical protein
VSPSISRLATLPAPFSALEAIGRALMEEASSMLGKAEEYFGRTITSAGLAIIGFAAVAAAIKSIWSSVVKPAYELYSKYGITAELLFNIGSAGTLLGLFMFLIGGFIRDKKERMALLETRKTLERAEDSAKRAEDLKVVSEEVMKRANDVFDRANDNVAASRLLMEASVEMLRAQGSIGQETADQILSLLSIEPETQP